MQGFTTPGTSELVSMSFLCLDKLVVDINTYQYRYAPLAANKRKQQSPYIISSSVSESWVTCFTINKKNSRSTSYMQHRTYQNITTPPKVQTPDRTDE